MRRLDEQMHESKKKLAAAVRASGISLTDLFGVGPFVAATVIGDVADVPVPQPSCRCTVPGCRATGCGAASCGTGTAPDSSWRRTRMVAIAMSKASSPIPAATTNARGKPTVRA